jgi:Lrp/AsnC family transcriptional regulator, leucine-responsive regulatory protein
MFFAWVVAPAQHNCERSRAEKWDEVLECHLTTGNRDYLLRVVAADLSSYEAFLKNKLTRLDGIASIESSFALSQVKYSIALPV